MKKRVLVAIDGSKRELFGCSLLAKYLRDIGLTPIICSQYLFKPYYLRYTPEAVVWPNALTDFSKIAKNTFIFILPSESGNGQEEQVEITHAGTAKNTVYSHYVDRFFCWGKGMKKTLLKSGKWREEQLAVTGNPSTDHWHIPRSKKDPKDCIVGLTTTFRALSNSVSMAKSNYLEWLDYAERHGGDGSYYAPPNHAESWLFYEASLARVINSTVRALVSHNDNTVEIRPHPFELNCRYQYLKASYGDRVRINKNGPISEWLKNKYIVFTYMSASAIDAIIFGIPVVSLGGLIDPDALKKIPKPFRYEYTNLLWQVDSFSQVPNYLEKARRGQLTPCRDIEKFNDFIKEHFFFPRRKPSAELIATEIKRVLDNNKKTVRYSDAEFLNDARGLRKVRRDVFSVTRHLIPEKGLHVMAVYKYLRGLLPGNQDIGYSFQPWRIRELKDVMRAADHIKGQDGT